MATGNHRLEMILPLIHSYGISQLSMFDYGRVVRNTAYCCSVCLPAALQSVLGHWCWLDLRFRCRDCRFVASAPTTVCCTPIVVCCIPMFLSYIYICIFVFIVIDMYYITTSHITYIIQIYLWLHSFLWLILYYHSMKQSPALPRYVCICVTAESRHHQVLRSWMEPSEASRLPNIYI